MRIIHRRDNANRHSGPSISITQVIAQALELVNRDVILVVQHHVMGWSHRALQPGMRDEEDVPAVAVLDDSARGDVAESVALAGDLREETRVVAFDTYDDGNLCGCDLYSGS